MVARKLIRRVRDITPVAAPVQPEPVAEEVVPEPVEKVEPVITSVKASSKAKEKL
jgi:hypothetical protein